MARAVANGDDRNLIPWIDAGLESVILLGKKHLSNEQKERLLRTFRD